MSFKCIPLALAGMVGIAVVGCRPSGGDHARTTATITNQLGAEDQSLARDWPQWRHDANHTAASPEELPARLSLHWTRQFAPRVQVWDDPLNNDLMQYDRIFEPVVLGERMFVGFNNCDKLVALDIRTGRELWTFFTDGPVRLPPAAWDGKVYFVSDDGHLYCVRAEDGSLVWKFRGGPSARKALGNGRVVSAWPARGGPVVRDGRVYFAASIWPFMGTFLYSLDAQTGQAEWVNDGTGAQYTKQPHSAPAFAGVAPQGPLVATRDFVLVPGGRSIPAAFDRKSGKFLYFQLEDSGKGNGGSFVAASETEFFVHTRVHGTRSYELKNGKKGNFLTGEPVLATNRLFAATPISSVEGPVLESEQKLALAYQGELEALADLAKVEEEGSKSGYKNATNALASAQRKVRRAELDLAKVQTTIFTNVTGYVIQSFGADRKPRWEFPADGTGDLIKAGSRLYAAGSNGIIALDASAHEMPRVVWSNAADGSVQRLLAANGMLFAVTLDGRILAFGSGADVPPVAAGVPPVNSPLPPVSPLATAQARTIIGQSGARQGYALCFGVEDGALLQALAEQSELRLEAVAPDATKIEQLRRRFDAAGLYGTRVALHPGDPGGFKAPPYIANVVLVGESVAPQLTNRAVLAAVYESVRPYGGTLWVATSASNAAPLAAQIKAAALPQAKITLVDQAIAVVREGALPGSADWTHQYGNVANTVKSDDTLVKLPLGVLWFGGPTHMDVLPRHGHGPSEQVAGGRLFIEGMTCLSARDVYTGRVLWKTDFGDLGTGDIYYDWTYTNSPLSTIYNQKHIPGANGRGANFVATADEVYMVVSNACLVLDARDGHTLRTIELPPPAAGADLGPLRWGYIGLYENLLLAGAGFADYTHRFDLVGTNTVFPTNFPMLADTAASRALIAFDRFTGQKLWQAESKFGFLHNGIVAGNGRVYCLDRLPKTIEDRYRRRNRPAPNDYRIVTFRARDGHKVWDTKADVFGTWLSYSPKHDLLLQAGAAATDRLKDEAEKGVIAYRGTNGAVVWKEMELKFSGPFILHNDTLLTTPAAYKTNAGAFNLADGKPRFLTNPLTGDLEPWRIYRTYGCNYPIACENLMTFRSGAAGFYDLETQGGTGNFGGFKSSCSANLIAAGGVLNAPVRGFVLCKVSKLKRRCRSLAPLSSISSSHCSITALKVSTKFSWQLTAFRHLQQRQ